MLITLLACSSIAFAHGDDSHGGGGGGAWWVRWNFDPLILFNIAVLSILYTIGLRRLWQRAGNGRKIGRAHAWTFAASMAAVVVALLSPIDPLSDELQSAHMVQHMTLMMIAAPLFVLTAPALVMLWALPARARAVTARFMLSLDTWQPARYLLWQPIALFALYAVVLWIWHLPALYGAALRDRWVHEFQHLTFFVASCLFWRVLLDPLSRLSLNRAAAVVYLFATSLHATVLGVFMALAPRVWYPEYVGRTTAHNLGALEDQQLAGLIMWMPACAVYAVVAAWLFGLLLREPGEAVSRT